MDAFNLSFGPDAEHLVFAPTRSAEVPAAIPGAKLAGWSGGRGPGIKTHQWPRNQWTGLPLMHVLSIELPEDYRRRSPDLVGIAYFAGSEHYESADAEEIIQAGQVPADKLSDPFWQGLQDYLADRHPQEVLREDVLEATHALIWLTADELAGRSDPPARHLPPEAEDIDISEFGSSAWGEIQQDELPVWLSVREDPNAGRAPNEDEEDGYVSILDLDEAVQDRLRDQPNHLGGSCDAIQTIPDGLTPYYLELEDGIGNVNYGAGNGQIDLESDTFDWSTD